MRTALIVASCLAVMAVGFSAEAETGAISGTVRFVGQPPEMKPLQVTADPVCHAMHGDNPPKNEVLVLGEGQTMANVFVHVTKGLPEGASYPVPAEPAVLTQKGCVYAPHVFVLRAGQKLKILNPDDTLHNVNAMPAVNKPFNKGMPKTLKEIEVELPKPEPMFPIKCDVHMWMRAYCAVLDHPFYAVTGVDGAFSIAGLAPGEYEIEAWHERLGAQKATLTVTADGTATQDFSFSRPTK